jgi:quercetin dioxygenase-like cupin family protein
MAHPGDVLAHPAFGVQIRFLATSEQTNGSLLRAEVLLPPHFSMAEHVHPRQEERHEVLAGTLRARVGGLERDYRAGERVIGPAGVPHAWRNPSDREALRIVSEHRPVLHMELMLEAGSAIARDFAADKRGALKHLLRAAVLMDTIKDDFSFTGWPMRALMALLVALAPAGRLLGYRSGAQEAGGQATATGPRRGMSAAALIGGVAATTLFAVGLVRLWHRRRSHAGEHRRRPRGRRSSRTVARLPLPG